MPKKSRRDVELMRSQMGEFARQVAKQEAEYLSKLRDGLHRLDELDYEALRSVLRLKADAQADSILRQFRDELREALFWLPLAEGGSREAQLSLDRSVERLWKFNQIADVLRGIKLLTDASKGGKAKSKADPNWQARVEAIMAANSHVSFTQARRFVAEQSGVSEKTVKRHTRKPAK